MDDLHDILADDSDDQEVKLVSTASIAPAISTRKSSMFNFGDLTLPGSDLCYPSAGQISKLWETVRSKVHPIFHILHQPQATRAVRQATIEPLTMSKSDSAWMFAMYFAATYITTEDHARAVFGQDKDALLMI